MSTLFFYFLFTFLSGWLAYIWQRERADLNTVNAETALNLLQSDPSIGVRIVEKGVGRDDQDVAMVEQGYQVETELF